jgi:ATP-binding cassette subfamily B multidrug efflux pump
MRRAGPESVQEQEAVMKGFDRGLMKRLLSYVKPYLPIFILSLAALLLATGGELLLPLIIQRTVDRDILPLRRALQIEQVPGTLTEKLGGVDPEEVIAGVWYLPADRLSALSGLDKEELKEKDLLSEESYLLIRDLDSSADAMEIVTRHPGLFTTDGRRAALPQEEISRLSKEEVSILRADNLAGVGRRSRLFLLALAAVFIFTFSQVYLQAYVGQMIMKDLRTGLFDHTLGLSLKYIDVTPVGRLVTRITNDVETINELFTTVLPSLLRDLALMAGVLAALYILSARLATITLLTLVPVLLLSLFFRVKARNAYRRVRLAVSRLNAFLSERISGMRIVQLFGREARSRREFAAKNDELLQANLGEMLVFATFRPLIDLLSTTSVAVIIYFGARLLQADMVSLGVLIAYLTLIRKFYEPVMDLSETYNILQSAMAGSERVFELLDTKEMISEPDRPHTPKQVRGEILFDRVSFMYKEGEPVLRDLSFRVAPGETVAIVGYTGAGKTTITSLLTRLWDIQEGAIFLDGTDIRRIPTRVLRSRVQSVLQDVFLFSGTIADNIRLGSDISTERLTEAVRLVRAESFISRLPGGLDTELQERGGNLSMGQRQLLSFARVVAHDPDVLVLDEATGNIDTETEKLIQEALTNLLRDRTSLVIAHRLSTIRNADRILVLHKGRLCETGTHDQLMAAEGLYYNLYKLQVLDEE